MIAPCVYIGDSIAVGLQGQDRKCLSLAKVGAVSRAALSRMSSYYLFGYVVISVGSNDGDMSALINNAYSIRRRVLTKTTWILPYERKRAYIIRNIAISYGDTYVDLAEYKSRDGIHPSYYSAVSRKIIKHSSVLPYLSYDYTSLCPSSHDKPLVC